MNVIINHRITFLHAWCILKLCSLCSEFNNTMEDLSASNQEAINKDSLMDDAKRRSSQQRLKMTLTHSTKDATTAFVLRTKVHGLKQAFSPYKSKTQRLFWLLAIFVCLGLFFTWSWNRILYLVSYPAVTKIYMVWSHNMTFPAVTFCNHNLLRVSSLTKADLYHSGYWMDIMHLNHTVNRQSVSMLKHSRHRERMLHLLDFSNYSPPPDYQLNTTEMIDRLGHQLEDMLLDCRFRGENCTYKNFTPVCKQRFHHDQQLSTLLMPHLDLTSISQ